MMPPEELYLSSHAIRRSIERGISIDAIERAVWQGEAISRWCDTTTYALRRLRVVVNASGLVITAFRLHRQRPKKMIKKFRQNKRKACKRFYK